MINGTRLRFGAAIADQVVSSASNFLVGVVIGRLAGVDQLGTYAIAFFLWLILIGLNRSVLTEPLVIFTDDLESPDRLKAASRSQLLLALYLAGCTALISALAYALGSDVWRTLLVLAVALPALFAQDFWRAVGFGVHRPVLALGNDIVFIVVQFALTIAFIVAGHTTAPWFVVAWAIGAMAGALVGFRQFRVRPLVVPASDEIRRLWHQSRWLLGDFVTMIGARELQQLFVALILPRADVGALRAAESLMGPSVVIKLSGGNIGLPTMTRSYRQSGYSGLMASANRFTIWVSGAQWLYCLVMVLVGPQMMVVLYGDEFSDYGWLIYVLSLQYAISATHFGQSIAVKVAEMARQMWVMRIFVSVTTLPVSVFLAAQFGLVAVVWFYVWAAVLFVVTNYAVYLPKWHERLFQPRTTYPWRDEHFTEGVTDHVRNRG
jgi:O-antigen/teichoic acid export membrane protein